MLTIVRRDTPPWMKPWRRWPSVMRMPDDFNHGDNLPRRMPDEPVFLTTRERAMYRAGRGVSGGSTAAAYAVNSAIFAAPAAVHTILDTIAPAGHGLAMVEAAISFDGVTSSAVPVYTEACVSTQGAAGTGGTAPTIQQTRGVATGGSPPTASGSHTAEPTTLVRVRSWYISPNGGLFVYPLPLGREIECGSTTGTQRALALRITPPATVNAQAYMEVESIG